MVQAACWSRRRLRYAQAAAGPSWVPGLGSDSEPHPADPGGCATEGPPSTSPPLKSPLCKRFAQAIPKLQFSFEKTTRQYVQPSIQPSFSLLLCRLQLHAPHPPIQFSILEIFLATGSLPRWKRRHLAAVTSKCGSHRSSGCPSDIRSRDGAGSWRSPQDQVVWPLRPSFSQSLSVHLSSRRCESRCLQLPWCPHDRLPQLHVDLPPPCHPRDRRRGDLEALP